jgi:DNA-binding NtrC family response regulator
MLNGESRMAKILVIDDEQEVRQVIGKSMELTGHEVVEALDGAEGVKLYKEEGFDIVITDIFMAVKTGLEVIQELKAFDANVKIIVASSVGIRDEIDMVSISKGYGAVEAFEKPLDLEQLKLAVENILESDA